MSNYRQGLYTLISIENHELYIKYIGGYDCKEKTEHYEDLLTNNLNTIEVFWGFIQDLEDENNQIDPKDVEGAIVNYLIRKPETRKYLVTTERSYNLKDCIIKFKFEDNSLISGLEEPIIVPPICTVS